MQEECKSILLKLDQVYSFQNETNALPIIIALITILIHDRIDGLM